MMGWCGVLLFYCSALIAHQFLCFNSCFVVCILDILHLILLYYVVFYTTLIYVFMVNHPSPPTSGVRGVPGVGRG